MGLFDLFDALPLWWRPTQYPVKEKPVNALEGKRLRYLIGRNGPVMGTYDEVTVVGYDAELPRYGIGVGYCNLFDEYNTGKYGPYLLTSETAAQYGEGQIDPAGVGWDRNLHDQLKKRRRQGFQYIELDNCDAYRVRDVLRAYEMAWNLYALRVLAKNPGIQDIEEDTAPLVAHAAVVGIIIERGGGTPLGSELLRRRADKIHLPCWFVAYGNGKRWATETAKQTIKYPNMYVTYSRVGEYESSEDV